MKPQDPRRQFSEQIARLQQRQLEIVQQTSQELEVLKKEVEESGIQEVSVTQSELAELHTAIEQLRREREEQNQRLANLEVHLEAQTAAIEKHDAAFRNKVRGSLSELAQHVHTFSQAAGSTLSTVLTELDSPRLLEKPEFPIELPLVQVPVSLPVAEPAPVSLPLAEPAPVLPVFIRHLEITTPEPAPALAEPSFFKEITAPAPMRLLPPVEVITPKKKSKRKEISRKVQPGLATNLESKPRKKKPALKFAFIFLVLAGAGYGAKKFFILPGFTPEPLGEVAGVSTGSLPTPTPQQESVTNEYKESFADLPLEETTWETSRDSDFGVAIEFPSNTTNRIHTVGSSNLWFLRKNGYMVKLTKFETELTLDAWMDENKPEETGSLTKTTFKDSPAWLLKGSGITATGHEYFLKRGGAVFEVWIKEEPPTTADGQRVARMVNSLQFLDK